MDKLNAEQNAEISPGQFEMQLLIESGDHYLDTKDFYAAIDCYTAAIELAPANAILYHKRGWAKAYTGDIKGELEDWNKAIEFNPFFDEAYADRAIAKVTLRDYKGALEDAKHAKELNPELKTKLEPIVGNISKRVDELELVGENKNKLSFPEVEDELQKLGNDRREFLKQITLVGMATMTAGILSGCGSNKLAGGAKNVKWGMIIDLKRCVGCKACTVACKVENHTPPGVSYNVVMEEEHGTYPHNKRVFIPRPCMHCEKSSCTLVCPVKATYHREDGIVVVDYDKCIGCRYCIAACPYGARSFDFGENYTEDISNPWETQPSPEYGQYRHREKGASPYGNVRKCTFCLHRIYNGIAPACSTTCMAHAIHFGNMADPEGKCMAHGENLHELLATRSYMRLKEEVGNEPRVYYLT
jgi:molybdopterin-containing oxidoreductase family iron-sulfur binding subunit